MTEDTQGMAVHGTFRQDEHGPMLVLSERLHGQDTFLAGRVDLGDGPVAMRIITLDDVTILRPAGAFECAGETWSGMLYLPHGLRRRAVPADLAAAARALGRAVEALDDAELRYALAFLSEAATSSIRAARIEAIVDALPLKARTR